jgi:hypothetical protein
VFIKSTKKVRACWGEERIGRDVLSRPSSVLVSRLRSVLDYHNTVKKKKFLKLIFLKKPDKILYKKSVVHDFAFLILDLKNLNFDL